MGVKELWTVLTPYCQQTPICKLRGEKVAIDLAGWVCEGLNVVDYYIHPRHYLKNIFSRTCYLLLEDITPIFVMDGKPPSLKNQVILKRNEMQFRGVKPNKESDSNKQSENSKKGGDEIKRTRFQFVLKECAKLLDSLGVQCIQSPGEAEAYCAFLNKKGLVDGVISQDSDCFAYGALRVYRNFTMSSHSSSQGVVDVYDMQKICESMDFGQNKIIAMALFCGCDYCPEGIGGIGRDSVLKLFEKYNDKNILERIKSWKDNDGYYNSLEMKVDDKNICNLCGHIGKTRSHKQSGCSVCRTFKGCDESLWKDEHLTIKAELALRKKALKDETFPSQSIINEFLSEPSLIPSLSTCWNPPNLVKFLKQISTLLQWSEITCFQKFFPIMTRWQICTFDQSSGKANYFVTLDKIKKKRTLKGVVCLEIAWKDEGGKFNGLIPDEQIQEYISNNPKGIQELWTTVEPLFLLERSHSNLVEDFFSKEKKGRKPSKKSSKENLLIKKNKQTVEEKGIKITGYFDKKIHKKTQHKYAFQKNLQCSTPTSKSIASDLESDADTSNISNIVDNIMNYCNSPVSNYEGKLLRFETAIPGIKQLNGVTSKSKASVKVNETVKRCTRSFFQNQSLFQEEFDKSFDLI